MDRVRYIVNVVIVALLFGAVAIGKDGRLLGMPAQELFVQGDTIVAEPIVTEGGDGATIINSYLLAEDVIGFGGRTPILIYESGGIITKVEAIENSETPRFMRRLERSDLLGSWDGLSLAEAMEAEVDIVSGATYSSSAIIENVRRAAAYGVGVEAQKGSLLDWLDFKVFIAILVIISGAVITVIRPRSRWIEMVQLALNVGVLGFWCSSYLSMAQVVSWLSSGFYFTASPIAIMLLALVIIMPLVGRKGAYCHMHCPVGSMQALLDRVPLPKLRLGARVSRYLNRLRYYIFMALMMMMWLGIGFEIMDYEIFSAFLLGAASSVVLWMAALFMLLSLFITKPYCRFICPTGAMLTIMQRTKM